MADRLHVVADPLRDQAQTFAQLIKTPGWGNNHSLVATTLQDMAASWTKFASDVRRDLGRLVCQMLSIEPVRFEFLMRAVTVEDFESALEYQPTVLNLSAEEKVYPEITGWLGDYLAYASGGEANIAFHFWAGLSALAACCRRQFYYNRGGHSGRALYPNLYVILEGPSGSGKGTAIFRALDMMERVNQLACDDKSRPVPPTIHLMPSKVTIQELVQILHTNRRQYKPMNIMMPTDDAYESCGVIIAEEATSLLGKQVMGVDALIGGLTEMYDGRLSEGTIKRGAFYLNNVSLTLLAGSTMDWLKESLTDDIFRGGFMGARCLLVSRKKTGRRFYHEPIADPVQRDHLLAFLKGLAFAGRTRLKLTPEADKWLEGWYQDTPQTGEADPRLAAFAERIDMHLLKVAMLLAISDGTTPWIEQRTLQVAAKVLEAESNFMVRALKLVSSRSAIDDMEFAEQVLWDAGGRLNQHAYFNKLRYRLGTRRNILECLGTLVMAGRMATKNVKTPHRLNGGIPRTDWVLKANDDIDRENTDDEIAEIHAELDAARERLAVEHATRERHEGEQVALVRDKAKPLLPLGGVGKAKGAKGNTDPWGGM